MDTQLMVPGGPAHPDRDGTERCGLPAEPEHQHTTRSTGGPPHNAKIRCPAGADERTSHGWSMTHHPGPAGAGIRCRAAVNAAAPIAIPSGGHPLMERKPATKANATVFIVPRAIQCPAQVHISGAHKWLICAHPSIWALVNSSTPIRQGGCG